MNKESSSFWQGKRVLVTGHTGFKGGWLALWLQRLGAEVTGLALAPYTHPNLYMLANVDNSLKSYECDIRDAHNVSRVVQEAKPEIVFHLAAQSLVRASYKDPLATYATNVQGTANVLNSLRGLENARVVVTVTTDKVYRNLEQPYPYRETDNLGGHDPYSASKAAAELVVASYRDAFLLEQGVAVATARAGNVIGGGDWAEDRLLPDAVRAWSAGHSLYIRRPKSVRPWQHVLEPLYGYLNLAEQLYKDPKKAGAYNFGPRSHEAATVRDVISQACKSFGSGKIEWGDGCGGPHEANWLALETAKARITLGVESRWDLAKSIACTMNWYRRQLAGESAQALCLENITTYESHI
ncbi:CDP-glucose 4,6-dehydratase [Halomonas sp. BL6]|uniref:CDP-glucose 4,6-dehydratase n=1 Tax=Halomonas sp. BL6 TaxID=2585770 RepID=UPI00111BC245|nr:CDP-glucose 4,6-dehydratase [Halomonas sp. BL6]TNH18521.1 CDP-glucose 4,6-dehydratase [Halomonas sp. BL6]